MKYILDFLNETPIKFETNVFHNSLTDFKNIRSIRFGYLEYINYKYNIQWNKTKLTIQFSLNN